MSKLIMAWIGIGLASTAHLLQAASQEVPNPAPGPAAQYSTVLSRYCFTCHNERLKTAGLMLDKMDIENIPASAEVWEKVIRKLRVRGMPPAGMPRPDLATYDSFATYLETELDNAAAAKPNPGRTAAIHRLNRAEYTNAIRDLLALEIYNESLLPPDDSNYGFDNIGEILTVSSALLERFMSAAEIIGRLAIGDPTIRPALATYEIPSNFQQQDRASEDLPFGSRGGLAVRHYFPLDGSYLIKIGLKKVDDGLYAGQVVGFEDPKQLDLRLDGERVQVFTVGGKSETTDADLQIRIPLKAGSHLVGVTFLKDSKRLEGPAREARDQSGVSELTIGGPYDGRRPINTPSRSKIFLCNPKNSQEEEPCAKKILSTLARRAYRRPVSDADIQPLLDLYRTGLAKGGFESGIKLALEGILDSPSFLFRVERDPQNVAPDTPYPISDLELASRLSFFLWSSIPDDELLTLAERGELKNPAVLEQQVKRMLADSRSKALVDNFAGQWLTLRSLSSKSPDRSVFPNFDDNLREALLQETKLFFDSIVRENRSVVDLLNADYTFLNERLARHYGIPNVYGSQFRRVKVIDENRRGLLGNASVLMATSYNTRTSPVLRGKWVLENILGTPPPPPPPDVPSLKDDKDAKALTMRQRMEQHRANPACAACHKLMDPLGFALENFDAVGQFRTTTGADRTPIDVSGALPDGTPLQGAAGLRENLLKNPEQFVDTFAKKLLTYALGRGAAYYDGPAIRRILQESAPDYRFSSIVLGIIKSVPFQMRESQSQVPAAVAGVR
ncbi:MAG: DUF1592 domain-containing protein [Acidobacteria bacterium]|nr:DUF1592 domain-containing protein [Acidobacteriota bacterium]